MHRRAPHGRASISYHRRTMSAPTSILIISGAPDDRHSTAMLRRLADAMVARPDVHVRVWFLRCAWYQEMWPDTVLVDGLRTWWPAAVSSRLGFDRVAGALRGLRLRSWLWRAQPDLVVLDDGLGERVLNHIPGRPVIVHRHNREETPEAQLEESLSRTPDAVLSRPDMPPDPRDGVRTIVEYDTRDDWSEARHIGRDEVRGSARSALGLPADVPLITGWGVSGWIDGPELFVRELWVMEHRHGVAAHGAWFGSDRDPHEVDRLRAEADRCGVGDRFHHLVSDRPADRLCGDLVFLPYRDEADAEELLVAICSGQAVVTFPVTHLEQDAVHVVDHLDLEAAGEKLARLLQEDRAVRWRTTLRQLDVQSLVEELVGTAWDLRTP